MRYARLPTVARYDKNKDKAKGLAVLKPSALIFRPISPIYYIYMERGRARATKGDQGAADKTADKTAVKLTA